MLVDDCCVQIVMLSSRVLVRSVASKAVAKPACDIVVPRCSELKRKPEVYYQRLLENFSNAGHKRVAAGITDITTDEYHGEIKQWRKWKEAVGQLLAYNVCDFKPNLHIYLFDNYSQQNKNVAMRVFEKYGIIPFEFIESSPYSIKLVDLTSKRCIHEYDAAEWQYLLPCTLD